MVLAYLEMLYKHFSVPTALFLWRLYIKCDINCTFYTKVTQNDTGKQISLFSCFIDKLLVKKCYGRCNCFIDMVLVQKIIVIVLFVWSLYKKWYSTCNYFIDMVLVQEMFE
jgi:hypothetical protein